MADGLCDRLTCNYAIKGEATPCALSLFLLLFIHTPKRATYKTTTTHYFLLLMNNPNILLINYLMIRS